MTEPQWVDVGSVEELSGKSPQTVVAGRTRIAIAYREGRFGAISAVCNHAGGPLGEGRCDGDYLVCPWHGWKFHFATGEEHKRDFIGNALDGRAPDVPRRKHDRFPLTVPVRFRVGAELEFHDGTLVEVSAGGGLLATPTLPPLGADVVVELTPPGAAAAMTVAARVSYHTPQGTAGLRFVSRDGDGARRLRELVRRLVVE